MYGAEKRRGADVEVPSDVGILEIKEHRLDAVANGTVSPWSSELTKTAHLRLAASGKGPEEQRPSFLGLPIYGTYVSYTQPPPSNEITSTKATERLRRPATHTCSSRMTTHARTDRVIPTPRRRLRIVPTAALSLAGKERIVERRMHAATSHRSSEAGPNAAAEGIVGPEPLRVQVALAHPRERAGHASSRSALRLELVFETRHGFWHRPSWMCERVVEGEWTGRGFSVFT